MSGLTAILDNFKSCAAVGTQARAASCVAHFILFWEARPITEKERNYIQAMIQQYEDWEEAIII